jgi:phage-related baseplate assembly protein
MSDEIDNLEFNEVNAGNIYTALIQQLEAAVSEQLYPGDERRIFGEGLVAVFVGLYNVMNDTAKQKMLRYARGVVLDALGERTATPRLAATPAKTVMRFSVAAPIGVNIIIPKWTKVTPNGDLYFATDTAAVLQAGDLFVDIPASGVSGGSAYNGFVIGTISQMVDLIPYVTSVSNIEDTYGGDDGEPYTVDGDNGYRERIRLSPSKFSTAGPVRAYEYYALSADPDIISARAVSPEPGVVTIYVLMDGGNIPTEEVLQKVLAAVNDETVRPLTDLVRVQTPTQVSYDIELTYYMSAVDEAAVIGTVEGANGAIAQYNKWQTETLGRDINPDELRKLILAPQWADGLVGAARVDVVFPQHTLLDGLSVAKFSGNIKVSHQVREE